MAREKRGRMTVRLSTELATALELSAERVGLPIATQAMLLLRQSLARTMDTKEYAERLSLARHGRTREEFLNDLVSAAEGLAHEQEGRQGSVPARTAAQAAGPLPGRGVGSRAGASGTPGMEEAAQGGAGE